jgi:hypothetical protein
MKNKVVVRLTSIAAGLMALLLAGGAGFGTRV